MLEVDPSYPAVNITCFGQVFEDFTVVNEDAEPLDYSFDNGSITVYTLGSSQLLITYSTQDLMKKDGRYWIFEMNSPIDSTILLPQTT